MVLDSVCVILDFERGEALMVSGVDSSVLSHDMQV